MRKGKIISKILESASESLVDSLDLFIAYLNAGYGANINKIEYEKRKLKKMGKIGEDEKKIKQRFRSLLHYMKKEKLIMESEEDKKLFKITNKGKKKLNTLREINKNPDVEYDVPQGNNIILVSFDIPERYKAKRNWLRKALIFMNFKQIHQSVLVGKGKLPKKFLEDLNFMKLVNYVEIMEISKKGTLEFRKLEL